MRSERAAWWPAVLICAAALAAYSNSFTAGFVLDSQSRILEDPRITAATPENLKLILTRDYWYPQSGGGIYRPLATLSFLFNYAILGDGQRPLGYHVLNLLLHWLNIALLFQMARKVSGDAAVAAAAAAVWALHPIATEAVTNIVGRADLMSTAAVLGALLCHMPEKSRPAALAAITAAGIFAKENAVVIPALMALYDFIFSRRPRWMNYAAVAAPLLLFWWARTLVLAQLPAVQFPYVMNPLTGAGFVASRLTAIGIIGRYLALLVWPARLSADYSYNQIPLAGWQDWRVLLTIAVCAAAIALAARRRVTLFFVLFFFAALVPTSNLLLRIGSIMAERFLYLPAVGFAVCVAFYKPARIAAMALAVVLGARTFVRNRDWQTNESLMASAVNVSPESFKTHWSMAYLMGNRNLDLAIQEIDQAAAILDRLPDERNAAAVYDLAGELYRIKGDESRNPIWYRASLEALERGVRIDRAEQEHRRRQEAARGQAAVPLEHLGRQSLYRHLGITRLHLGETDKAAEALEFARSLNPGDPAVYVNLAAAYGDDARRRLGIVLQGVALAVQPAPLIEELARAYPLVESEVCPVASVPELLRLQRQCPKLHGHLCASQREAARWLAENRYPAEAEKTERQARGALGCAP